MSNYSVVIPAHNAADTIATAIGSVRAQRLLPAEILVIDDGSADATATAADEAGAVVVRLSHNRGAAAARNVGIAVATSPRVAFLDADDVWLPSHLESVDAAFTAVPEAAVAFGQLTKVLGARRYRSHLELAVHRPLDMLGPLLRQNRVPTSAAAVDRATVLSVGGMRPEFRIAHDYDLWLRLASSRSFVRIGASTVQYSIHPGQLTAGYLELLKESWTIRLRLLDSLPPPLRERYWSDVKAGWADDLRRSWTRRSLPELKFLLSLADQIPDANAMGRTWYKRMRTLRWLRWPLRFWDAMPVGTRFRLARWRGRTSGDLLQP